MFESMITNAYSFKNIGVGMTTYFCYVLSSSNPKYKNQTYIGFTVRPSHRIRQHNGEVSGGAKKTSTKRPWVMIANIRGFTSKISALQFEWAWQNPHRALKVKDVISQKTGIGKGKLLRDKIKILWEMCSIPPWSHQPLTINIFPEHSDLLNKIQREKKYVWPALPSHVEVEHKTFEQLPSNTAGLEDTQEQEGAECHFCEDLENSESNYWVRCPFNSTDQEEPCNLVGHVHCFAQFFLRGEPDHVLMPRTTVCPTCDKTVTWPRVITSKYKYINTRVPFSQA